METSLLLPLQLFEQQVRYEIPAFQRRYVWKQEEQWEPLWDDVEHLAQSIAEGGRTEPHFMGAIVLQQKQVPSGTRIQHRIVVDGQQRLTTLQLLVDAIQEVLEERGYTIPAERLEALVENRKAYRDGNPDNAFKVWPTIVDREAFRHAMSNELSVKHFAESRIVQAHNYFKNQAKQWLDKFPGEIGTRDGAAEALERVVGTELQLVVIDLGATDDPHIIFETLNARGTPLLQSDMIKNKILHDANIQMEHEDSVSPDQRELWPFDEDDWWSWEVGRGVQRRPRIDLYLNHWLTLRNRAEMKSYDEFNAFDDYADKRKEAGETIRDVARDMKEIGEIFRDIEEERRTDIAKFLERRSAMNVGVVTPLLLWLLSAKLPPATRVNCLKWIESFLVRRTVCDYNSRAYNKFFVSLIAKVADGPADRADQILSQSLAAETGRATKWPNDEELRETFITAPLYRKLTQVRIRMVLTGIEEQLRTERAETLEAPRNLHIEHIMPQAWGANWPLLQKDDEAAAGRERAIHTIGNLTLVNGRLNSTLSNAAWDSKRKTLADHSVLFLNKHIVNDGPPVWNETAITKRATWLCEKAVKVWPHPGSDA